MKYSEIKKQLQSLQKRAHDAAKGLPKNYETVIEAREIISEDTYYAYYLAIYDNNDERGNSIFHKSSNIYPFWTDKRNLAELEKTITDFLAFVEEIKNANK